MATSDKLLILGAVLVGVCAAGVLLRALGGVERGLRATAPTLQPSRQHGPWWAALGGLLTLASISIVCVVWQDAPEINLAEFRVRAASVASGVAGLALFSASRMGGRSTTLMVAPERCGLTKSSG